MVNMKMSELIATLEKAKAEHGDLPVYTYDSGIAALKVHACFDGGMSWTDGKPDHIPNEFILEFIPA